MDEGVQSYPYAHSFAHPVSNVFHLEFFQFFLIQLHVNQQISGLNQ